MDVLRPFLSEKAPPLNVSDEQRTLVRNVLLLTSSDSNFAQKAATSIEYILTNGPTGKPPGTPGGGPPNNPPGPVQLPTIPERKK